MEMNVRERGYPFCMARIWQRIEFAKTVKGSTGSIRAIPLGGIEPVLFDDSIIMGSV